MIRKQPVTLDPEKLDFSGISLMTQENSQSPYASVAFSTTQMFQYLLDEVFVVTGWDDFCGSFVTALLTRLLTQSQPKCG